MRKLILQIMVTLDGFVSGPNGELDWLDYDPVMGKEHYKLAEEADTALMGHSLYSGMADFWPKAATNPNTAPNEAAFAKLMNKIPKTVFATKKDKLEWNNSTLILVKDGDDLARKVTELKKQPGGYLLLYGGIQTVQTLIAHDLIDEYWLDMCPRTLGAGKSLFPERLELNLVEVKPYKSGAITLRYRPKK